MRERCSTDPLSNNRLQHDMHHSHLTTRKTKPPSSSNIVTTPQVPDDSRGDSTHNDDIYTARTVKSPQGLIQIPQTGTVPSEQHGRSASQRPQAVRASGHALHLTPWPKLLCKACASNSILKQTGFHPIDLVTNLLHDQSITSFAIRLPHGLRGSVYASF